MAGTQVPQNDGLITTKNWRAMANDFRYRALVGDASI